jgi:hypothetical protein
MYRINAAKGERIAVIEPLEEKMARLSAQWRDQKTDAQPLAEAIEKKLALLGFRK